MSSPAQPRVLLRHSLYIWVLLAMVGILSLSFVAFRAISEQMQAQKIDPVYDRFLDVHISHLRKKLEGGRSLIRTVRGVGYVFTGAA